MRIAAVVLFAALSAGCTSSRDDSQPAAAAITAPATAPSGSSPMTTNSNGLTVVGNENGGTITGGASVPPGANAAMRAHCARVGKKPYVTRWGNAGDGGLIVFQCHPA